MPGTAGGTVRCRHVTVAAAIAALVAAAAAPSPERTMLGLSNEPSR